MKRLLSIILITSMLIGSSQTLCMDRLKSYASGALKGMNYILVAAAITNCIFAEKWWIPKEIYVAGLGSTILTDWTLGTGLAAGDDEETRGALFGGLGTILTMLGWQYYKNKK